MPDTPLAPKSTSVHERRGHILPQVFIPSVVLLAAFITFGVGWPHEAATVLPALLTAATGTFGWVYVAGMALFLVLALWMMLGPARRLRLGTPTDRPEFPRLAWFAMLFSAGMGIGLVFYGVAEPMMHFTAPPDGLTPRSAEAARLALPLTFFHWGIHAWACYVMMAVGVGFFAWRRGMPVAVRSLLHPVLGDRIHGWLGHTVDTVAILGTLVGLATSLGYGAMQIAAGLERVFAIPDTQATRLVIVALVTGFATLSLVTGIQKGIRRLSELNLLLALLLVSFVFVLGPTSDIVVAFFEGLWGWAEQAAVRTFRVRGEGDGTWEQSWTLFYWSWWIAWSPFVGVFIARISRGRRVGEMVAGSLLVPVGATFVWMTTWGRTALSLQERGVDIAGAVERRVSTAIYAVLDHLPLSSVTATIAVVVVIVFFVTSSDSASLVVDMLASGGHPKPPIWQRVFWAALVGCVAAVLLLVAGGEALSGMQAAVVLVGLPFAVVLIVASLGLARTLWRESRTAESPSTPD